jgi:hypothetical protein
MSVKVYSSGGVILAEEAGKDTLSFTPQNTDLWVSGNQLGFTDNISKQTTVIGNYTDIVKKNDLAPTSLVDAITYLSSLFNAGILEMLKNPTFTTQVALGKIPGVYAVNKFGENSEITTSTDPEDVWDFGGLYNFSTSAAIDVVSSSSALDSVLITVEGLDANWDRVIQDVQLIGQNKILLSTPLIRVYRAFNANGTDLIGDVYIYEDTAISGGIPTDTSKIRAMIKAASNQTEMMIYSVPAGKTAVYLEGFIAISRGGGSAATAEMTFRAREFGKVFRVKRRIALNTQGSSNWRAVYAVPAILPEKTDVLFRVELVSATLGVSGGFQALIFDNDLWEL